MINRLNLKGRRLESTVADHCEESSRNTPLSNLSSTLILCSPSLKLAFLKADGAHDIHKQLDLLGEPLIPELVKSFQLRDPINLLKYQDLTLEGRNYSAAYSDYWNSAGDDEDG